MATGIGFPPQRGVILSNQPKRKSGASTPVSAHRAFPAIVALWFAALLGIGSLVLPMALFERIAEATGLASIFPAAQAPVGLTARLMIALAMGALGALAGIEIARKIAASAAPKPMARRAGSLNPVTAHAASPAKRPISAHEELGEGGLDADIGAEIYAAGPASANRRRALSVTDESARSDFLEFAPLPGMDPYAAEPAELDLGAFDAVAGDEGEPELLPLEVSTATDEPQRFERPFDPAFGSSALSAPPVPGAAHQIFQRTEPVGQPMMAPQPDPFEDQPMTLSDPAAASLSFGQRASASDFSMPEPQVFPPEPAPQAFAPGSESASDPAPQPALADLGIAQLVERFALALEGRRYSAAATVALQAASAPVTAPFAEGTPEPRPEPRPEPQSMPQAMPQPMDFDAALAPFAAPEASPVSFIPAALQPVGFDDFDNEDEDEDEGLPPLDLTSALGRNPRAFAVPTPTPEPAPPPVPQAFEAPAVPQPFVAPAPVAMFGSAEGSEEADESTGDDSYSSLLAMKSPFGLPREAVRIDDADEHDGMIEPVVIFPADAVRSAAPAAEGFPREAGAGVAGSRPFDAPQARLDALAHSGATPLPAAGRATNSADTERALREALEKLQRMSGAA